MLGGLLRNAGTASAGIVAGMVETAGATRPGQLLTAAGVKKALSDQPGSEAVFDFSGFEVTLQPGSLLGATNYILLHRGDPLDEKKLTVQSSGQASVVFYDGGLLEDGAWLLLRLRRSNRYSGVRPWYQEARHLRSRLDALMSDYQLGVLTQEAALVQLLPGPDGKTTIFDAFTALRAIITDDGVLTEIEAGMYIGQLAASVAAARKAVKTGVPATFGLQLTKLGDALSSGLPPGGDAGVAFEDAVAAVATARSHSLVAEGAAARVPAVAGSGLYQTLQGIAADTASHQFLRP